MILYRREGINHGNKVHFMYTSAVESALCNTENLYSTSRSAVFNVIQNSSWYYNTYGVHVHVQLFSAGWI